MRNSEPIWTDEVAPEYDPNTPITAVVAPGDILVFDKNMVDESGNEIYDHVAMVAAVNYPPDGRALTRSDVVLIEAAAGIDPRQYSVLNTQTWQRYRDGLAGYTLYLRRLKLSN